MGRGDARPTPPRGGLRNGEVMSKTSTTSVAPVRELKDLTRLVQRAPGFPEVLAALKNGRSATIDGAWGSAGPLAAAALGLHAPRTLLVVLAHVGDVDDFRDDVATFAGVVPEVFPAWDRLPQESSPGDEVFGRRLRVLKRLGGEEPPRFVVAPMQALLQPVPTAELLARTSRMVRVGDTIAVEELAAWLVERGMSRVEVVEVAGEFSMRGGIVDIFSPDEAEPVRIEFFGDDVESIRPFDPETQRSLGRWESVTLTATPSLAGDDLANQRPPADALPEGTWVALVEPNEQKKKKAYCSGHSCFATTSSVRRCSVAAGKPMPRAGRCRRGGAGLPAPPGRRRGGRRRPRRRAARGPASPPVPAHRASWDDAVEAAEAKLHRALMAAPRAVHRIGRKSGGVVFEVLPIHTNLKAHDREMVVNNVRFLLCRVYADMERELDGPALVRLLSVAGASGSPPAPR